LYGFPREPEATDVETPEPFVPPQRVTSAPVAVPSVPPEPSRTPDSAFAIPEGHISPPSEFSHLPEFGPLPTSAFGLDSDAVPYPNGGSAGNAGASATSLTSAPVATPRPAEEPALDPGNPDVPEIPPWDRKPLLVVIASAAVLVLIAIISGIATAAMSPNFPAASWREAGTEPSVAPTVSQPAVAPVANDTVTLSGVGDVIMGSVNLGLPPNNGAGFFDPVKQALASDLVMGNLETPLSDPTGYDKCGPPPHPDCFQFTVPPSYANHLRDGGFQMLNLANNHTNDQGTQGLANTRAALTAAGLQYTGGIGQISYMTVKGVKVAVLGFSVYSWGANLNNIPAAVELVQQAAAQADLVVIQMQGGAEGSYPANFHVEPGHEFFAGEDRGDLMAFSHAVIDAGADVIFGHGPHIMRGMEFYKGRLIAYSLGNFCGYKALSTAGFSGVGGVLKVTLHKDGSWASGSLIATEMVNGGLVAVDTDLRALTLVAGLSKDDFGANAAVISTTDGMISPPV